MAQWSVFRPIVVLFLAERRNMLLAGAFLAAVTVWAGIALLGISGWFITATAIAGLSSTAALVFDVFAPAASIRFLSIFRTVARYGERVTTHEATLGVLAGMREQLFKSWAQPGAALRLARQPAKLLFRLTADIDALDSLYLRILVPAAVALGTAFVVAVAFGVMNPIFGICAGAWLLLVGFGIPLLAARYSKGLSRRRAHSLEALRSRAVDLVAGQTDLVMAGQLETYRLKVKTADNRLANADDALNRIETAVIAGFGMASTLFLGGTLFAVAQLAQIGIISGPVAALGLLIALAALEPFAGLRRGAVELGRTFLAARRLGPALARSAPLSGINLPSADHAVRLDAVSVTYKGSPLPSLHDISFSLKAGERLALIGASGSGKSTLLALIAGEITADAGQVESLPTTLFTQRTELFQDSLRDNLRLAAPDAPDARLFEVLAIAGLTDFVASLPEGLATRLGEAGLGLSGGQARRLALARLLLRNAPIWLLDEPTEGLDGETARDVLERLAYQIGTRALIIATHIKREAMLADRLLLLERGRIVQAPRKGEPEFYAALSGLRPD